MKSPQESRVANLAHSVGYLFQGHSSRSVEPNSSIQYQHNCRSDRVRSRECRVRCRNPGVAIGFSPQLANEFPEKAHAGSDIQSWYYVSVLSVSCSLPWLMVVHRAVVASFLRLKYAIDGAKTSLSTSTFFQGSFCPDHICTTH
jgi:hypothetical protein